MFYHKTGLHKFENIALIPKDISKSHKGQIIFKCLISSRVIFASNNQLDFLYH